MLNSELFNKFLKALKENPKLKGLSLKLENRNPKNANPLLKNIITDTLTIQPNKETSSNPIPPITTNTTINKYAYLINFISETEKAIPASSDSEQLMSLQQLASAFD